MENALPLSASIEAVHDAVRVGSLRQYYRLKHNEEPSDERFLAWVKAVSAQLYKFEDQEDHEI
jgi:hypothetical protein